MATLAGEVQAEAQALRVARERVPLLRRDCAKLIQALGVGEGALGAAVTLRDRYAAIVCGLPRVPAPGHLEEARAALAVLTVDVCIFAERQANAKDKAIAEQARERRTDLGCVLFWFHHTARADGTKAAEWSALGVLAQDFVDRGIMKPEAMNRFSRDGARRDVIIAGVYSPP